MREQTLNKLKILQLKGMAQAYEDQLVLPDVQSIPFDQRFGLLVDQEEMERNNRRYQVRLKSAKLREMACIEDLDFKTERGIDKSMILSFASGEWIKDKQNILITGPTGSGKTFIACALVHKALQLGFSAKYFRLPRLLQELQLSRSDGRYLNILNGFGKVDILVIDDWGLNTLSAEQRRDILEVVEDRYATRSILMASQLPVDRWFDVIGDPTIADAIMDRVVHRSHRINLKDQANKESMRAKVKGAIKRSK